MTDASAAASTTPQELLLTVAICTLNRADDLRRAIQSVLEQGLDPARHELLIVDNASTDGTPALVERLSERRAGIRLVREQPKAKFVPWANFVPNRISFDPTSSKTLGQRRRIKDPAYPQTRVLRATQPFSFLGAPHFLFMSDLFGSNDLKARWTLF